MERLKASDLRQLLDFVRDLYAFRALDALIQHLLVALPGLVPSDLTGYGEVVPHRRRFKIVEHPTDVVTPSLRETFLRYSHEHPFSRRHQGGGDGSAVQISDLVPHRLFRRLGVYNEFFRQVGVDREMCVWVPAPRPLQINFALHRQGGDFSERDRLVLNVLRPHLAQAYGNAEAVTLLRHAGGVGGGVLLLKPDGQGEASDPRLEQWLATYFGDDPGRLPDVLTRWIRQQEELLHRAEPAPPEPLIVNRDGRRLTVRLFPGPAQRLLLFTEEMKTISASSLDGLGLTRRETEVLSWVAKGKTNEEIARILGMSHRTVAKHLEMIYPKLGVENRTAAAARAISALQEGSIPKP